MTNGSSIDRQKRARQTEARQLNRGLNRQTHEGRPACPVAPPSGQGSGLRLSRETSETLTSPPPRYNPNITATNQKLKVSTRRFSGQFMLVKAGWSTLLSMVSSKLTFTSRSSKQLRRVVRDSSVIEITNYGYSSSWVGESRLFPSTNLAENNMK